MPENINSVTINITLEGIEKINNWKRKWQENSLNTNASIYQLNGLYFALIENAQSWLEIKKPCHSGKHKRKVQKSLLVSVEINSTIAKLTVCHNWLNRVRLAWSHKTFKHFATANGFTTVGIYTRIFSWNKRTTNCCNGFSILITCLHHIIVWF